MEKIKYYISGKITGLQPSEYAARFGRAEERLTAHGANDVASPHHSERTGKTAQRPRSKALLLQYHAPPLGIVYRIQVQRRNKADRPHGLLATA